ncbi:MAG: metallophosphoesterase [Saprospiraceae bacterium]|nr:metallophosphoesterase [Saprospiraceae bacterium]
MKRRTFLTNTALASSTLILPNTSIPRLPTLPNRKQDGLTFGIVTDVHHGMLPDTEARLSKFIAAAIDRDVDFIIQMGDFCHPGKKSSGFLKIWQQFNKPAYHVLGNHDMDLTSKAGIMEFWEMPSPYYTFESDGIRFIILDANFLYRDGTFIDYEEANFYVDNEYRTYIDEEQIEWFAAELDQSDKPIMVFSHQSLWHYQWGVKNRLLVQKHLERNAQKIICCLNGHNHIDFHHHQNNIDYVEVNSMSYQWMGDKHQIKRYPQELLKDFKWLNHIAPYQDPLYAFASIDYKYNLTIEGIRSRWMPPSPSDAGFRQQVYGNQYSPAISDYKLTY